jgi:hypothetical protein
MKECMICGGKIVLQCRCRRADAECENGHSYHWSPFHNEYHEGMSDHSTGTGSPECCSNKEVIIPNNAKNIKGDPLGMKEIKALKGGAS